MTLEVKDLHVEIKGTEKQASGTSSRGKEILKGVSLKFKEDNIHVLMGPNGSGKSTLANAVMGHPKYKITKGKILLDGKDITNMKADERARAGLFLSFQHPITVPGVKVSNFLRTAVNNVKGKKYNVLDFNDLLQEKMKLLKMDSSFANRSLNEGFSGGEKKRLEILQMLLLEPKYAFLDETDSGLDVDAIKTVAKAVNEIHKKSKMGIIVITHYNRFLEFLEPEEVSVICKGVIVQRGNCQLIKKIEKEGFGNG
jgi:Fe-S cluster assembly ATP-binding protein